VNTELATQDLTTSKTLHVHVVNDPGISDLFDVEEDQFWTALAAEPELRERIRLTIGRGDEGLFEAAETADVLIGWEFRHRELVQRAPNLRWIHIIGAGVEHLAPIDWLPDGVTLTNSSGVHVRRSGEFVACSLLMLSSRVPQHVTNQRRHRWVQAYSDTIDGKVIVVIGVGQIGGEGARRAKELGLHVRGVRRSGASHPSVDRMYRPDELHEALIGADYVLVAAATTPETRQMLGGRELDLLNADAGVINLARADIVDYEALAERLRSGALRGAVLDVFDPEPLPEDSPLWDCENLVITPHVSSDPSNYNEIMLALFVDNCARFVAGEPLRNVVQADRGY
jgi:phosphoglycerate dehydrogenase-like enzyme